MSWRVAKSLLLLREQVNAAYPTRGKDSDGTIGNAEHASRSSDHNPWVQDGAEGVVTAMDITHDPPRFDSYGFAEMLRRARDPRIKYVISNRRIWNSQVDPYVWRPYHGSNPHDHHVHISVLPQKSLYDSTTPWKLGVVAASPTPTVPVKQVRSTARSGDTSYNVEYLQRMLGVKQSGVFDEETEAAVQEFQKRYGLVADGVVGPYTWRQLEA